MHSHKLINVCWTLRTNVTAVQDPGDTAQTSVLLPLGPETATHTDTTLPTQSPVNLTFVYPAAGKCKLADLLSQIAMMFSMCILPLPTDTCTI